MLDIGATELLMIVIVAVIVIGPKDMPLALRTAGKWMGKVRRLSNHFRSGLDAMIREAEMEEMEKKWREQNERIMREHPADAPPEAEPTGALPAPRREEGAPLPGTLPPPLPLPSAAETATASDEAPAASTQEAPAAAGSPEADDAVRAEARTDGSSTKPAVAEPSRAGEARA